MFLFLSVETKKSRLNLHKILQTKIKSYTYIILYDVAPYNKFQACFSSYKKGYSGIHKTIILAYTVHDEKFAHLFAIAIYNFKLPMYMKSWIFVFVWERPG